MKHIFIINPIAGKRNQSDDLTMQIKNYFSDVDYVIELTKYKGHATKLVSEYAKTNESIRFYSCGGDGTLNEIVNGMYLYPNTQLAIIPIGTGNDFIKYFTTLSQDDFLDFSLIKKGNVMTSDLLKCNDHVCLNIASVGFDANVVQKVNRFKRIPLVSGKMAYLLSVFNCFFSSMKFKYALSIDDIYITKQAYIFVVAANASFYGGGFYPTPMAHIDDGYMDVLTITSLSRLRVLSLINAYKKGDHLKYDFTFHKPCHKLKIMGDKEIILNMDGEVIQVKNPEIVLIPKAITLVLPNK